MGKIIYLEDTIILLTGEMGFKTEEDLESYLENNFTEKTTLSGVTYFIKKETT